MTDTPTPEAVERLCKALRGAEHALHDADLDSKASTVAEAVATLRALLVRVDALTTGGICEVAAVNPNVMDYMRHWEGRAGKAEAQVDALTKEREDNGIDYCALMERYDAAIKDRDEAEHAHAYELTLRMDTQAERDAALAASGAVAEAMREAAAGTCRSYSAVHAEFSIGHGQAANNLARRLAALPIPPDAAAALSEDRKRVREAALDEAAEIAKTVWQRAAPCYVENIAREWKPGSPWDRGYEAGGNDAAAAILARKEG